MKIFPRLLPPLLMAGLLGGCGTAPAPREAAAMPDYPTRFLVNHNYQTVAPVVGCIYHEPFSQVWVDLQGPVIGPLPASEEPDSGGLANSYRTYEVIPAGTTIHILKVHPFYAYVDEGSTTEIAAVLASGPYRGKPVKFARLCQRVVTPSLPQGFLVRDPAFLKEAD